MGVLVRLWVLACIFRLFNAVVVTTYFAPDEYWQTQEVAYSLVFGAGYRTWEWIPASACAKLGPAPGKSGKLARAVSSGPLRSIVSVLPYLPSYWLVRLFSITSPWVVGLAPRTTQALLAATGDVYTAAVAAAAVPEAGPPALLFALLSPWLWFTSTRTLANSTEAVLVLVALYFWPLDLSEPRRRQRPLCSLVIAAVTLLVRPSTAIIFAYLGMRTLLSASDARSALRWLLLSAAVVSVVLTASVLIDSCFYGELAVPILSFGARNLLHGLATFYGSAPWHFYLTQALPLLGGAGLLLAIQGTVQALRQSVFATVRQGKRDETLLRVCAELALVYLLLHSILGHKEHRFVQPIAYFAPVLAATQWLRQSHTGGAHTLRTTWANFSPPLRAALVLAFAAGTYLTTIHQRGQILITQDLAHLARQGGVQSVGWLMPCHSTPWHASLHTPSLYDTHDVHGHELRRMWFLTCSPPVSCTSEGPNSLLATRPGSAARDVAAYTDLADQFYLDPAAWLQASMAKFVDPSFPPARAELFRSDSRQTSRIPWPSHIVLFEALRHTPGVQDVLLQRGYALLLSRWNAPFTDDSRRAGRIEVWSWQA